MGVIKAAEPIRYTVRFPAPTSHYAEIEAIFPLSPSASSLEVFLPVWTPGSYLVREYARNLEDLRAFDSAGSPLALAKTRKNRWSVPASGRTAVTLRYKVYCHELSVRTNWIDENFALLQGAATFLNPVGAPPSTYEVHLELPAAWKQAFSGLAEIRPAAFRAPDYDTLVDSPILAGNPVVHAFDVAGKHHFLVNQGETPLWDGARAAKDTQKLVEQNLKLWGALPYDKYVFLNLIVDAGGGLEHKNSMTIMSGRYATRTHKSYLGWLGLVSHEFLHAWNVKRLRPVELGPFDYEAEVYTHNLWIAEGFTEYYSGLNARRAGLATDPELLGVGALPEIWSASLSALIEALQNTPGRLSQPLGMASFDSWIKLYRPDENSVNSAISYYVKGAVVAWLLDAHIRQLTNDSKSLDDLMRLAYSRYAGERGYTTPQFIAAASEVAGQDLTAWFAKSIDTTAELDYAPALTWFGLEFRKADPPKSDSRSKAWTGFQTRPNNGRLVVSAIPRDTPAAEAGLSAEDEILAVDNWRVTADGWAQRLEQYSPGDSINLLVSRRERLITVALKLGEEPARNWQVQISPQATPAQKQRFAAWTR